MSSSRLPRVKQVAVDRDVQRVEISINADQSDLGTLRARLDELGCEIEPAS